MRGLQKSKRVCWAPDANLCQVRLFLSEESPLQVGLGTQDHLQAKASWMSHSAGFTTDDNLPPGFEGGHPTNQSHIKLSEIPVIKWRCPPRLVLNLTWQVVAGEESKEVEVQNQREMRILEAVYPRPSAIPPNPALPADVVENPHNDHQIPLVPITPIEDEEAADTPSDFVGSYNIPMGSQPQLLPAGVPPPQCISSIPNTPVNEKLAAGVPLGVEPDMVAAASAAFAAINKSNDQGSLIDQDLLIKILGNPKLIEKLVTDYGAACNVQNMSKPTTSFVPSSDALPPPVTLSDPAHLHMNRTESSTPSSLTPTSGPYYAQPNGVGLGVLPNARVPSSRVPASPVPPIGAPQVGVPPSIGAPQVKDVNYYKKLIQQHGGERQETPQQFGSRHSRQVGTNQELVNPKPRDSKAKSMKPCIYFNSSRGCRHGANCSYQHDVSSQQRGSSIPEAQSAKRMKMDREISS